MKVGGPLASQFGYLYQQAMKPDQVTDGCVPTQWFGPMAKASFPQKTTLTTWWNASQDGGRVVNDGVAAFNYQPPPCQHFRKFQHDFGTNIFLGAAVLVTVVGSLFLFLWRSQIKADLRREAALEAVGALPVDENDVATDTVPDETPSAVTPPPRPASDTFDVDEIRSLADPQAASGRKRD